MVVSYDRIIRPPYGYATQLLLSPLRSCAFKGLHPAQMHLGLDIMCKFSKIYIIPNSPAISSCLFSHTFDLTHCTVLTSSYKYFCVSAKSERKKALRCRHSKPLPLEMRSCANEVIFTNCQFYSGVVSSTFIVATEKDRNNGLKGVTLGSGDRSLMKPFVPFFIYATIPNGIQ